MVAIDPSVPLRFLRAAFEPTDAIGVLLKTYRTGQVIQRIVPVDAAISDRFQSWLRYLNSHGWNVYVGVNAYRPGRSRARSAVAHVRHLFLEEDVDGPGLLGALSTRPDLPPPSYVLHSSPGRVHVMWRVRDIATSSVELLQKQLARELLTDRAATSCAQTTRLPGYFNHKRKPSMPVTIEYLRWREVFTAADLPLVRAQPHPRVVTAARRSLPGASRADRARAFLERVDPAVSGQCGDLQTFRVCCRIVRGFDLSDDEAVGVLTDWNARCEPPWSEHELRQKVANARKYGREPLGGRL